MAPPRTWNSRFTRTEQEQGVQAPPPKPLPSHPSPRLWLGSLAGDRNDSKLGIPWTSTITLRYDCLTALRVPSSSHMHACLTPCHA